MADSDHHACKDSPYERTRRDVASNPGHDSAQPTPDREPSQIRTRTAALAVIVASVMAVLVGTAIVGAAAGPRITVAESYASDLESELGDAHSRLADAEWVIEECQSIEQDLRDAAIGLDEAYFEARTLVGVAIDRDIPEFEYQLEVTESAYDDAMSSFDSVPSCDF